MNNGKEFINIFNKLESYFREKTNEEKRSTFYNLVDKVSKNDIAVKHHNRLLKKFGNLRNVIVHDDDEFPDKLIAEPCDKVLAKFKLIYKSIINPTKVIPKFKKKIRLFYLKSPLSEALKYMIKNDYSQIIVKNKKGLNLLSFEGISNWLGSKISDEIIDITDSTIADALRVENKNNVVFFAKDNSVLDALYSFKESINNDYPRIYAIIITNSGKKSEKPLGIITPWDLWKLDEQL